jgi:hypothetical protein
LPWAEAVFGEVGAGGEVALALESPGLHSVQWTLRAGERLVHVPSELTELRIVEHDADKVLDAGIGATDLAAARPRG